MPRIVRSYTVRWALPILFLVSFVVVSLFLAGPSAQAREEEEFTCDEWRPVTDSDWAASENDALDIHHAVILFDGTLIDDESEDDWRTVYGRYRRVRVFDEPGIEESRTVEIPFGSDYKMRDVHARTIKPDGTIIEVPDREIYEKTLISYRGQRVRSRSFAFKGVEPGDIVEYRYRMEVPTFSVPITHLRHRRYCTAALITWRFQPTPAVSAYDRALVGDFLYQPSWLIPRAAGLVGEVKPLPSPESPRRVRVFFQNLPPLPDEPFMPALQEVAPFFVRSYIFPKLDAKEPYWERTAKRFGKETREYVRKRDRLDKWMAPILEQPRNLESDIALCFEAIHRDIRNADFPDSCGVLIDAPELKNVDDVLERRIGETSDINYLLLAMLRRLGHETTLFWIRDRSEGAFREQWQTPRQFTMSGVAVKKGGSIRWLFPALRHAGPRTIPWQANDSRALLENLARKKEENGFPTLANLPLADASENLVDLTVRLRPEETGRARGRLEARWRCAADPLDLEFLSQAREEDARAALKKRALQDGLSWRAFDETFSLADSAVAYACSLEVDGIVEQAGSRLLVNLGAIRPENYRLPEEPRQCQLHFEYPQELRSHVRLEIPQGYQVETAPRGGELARNYLQSVSSFLVASEWVKYERDLTLVYNFYRPEAAEPLRLCFDRLYAVDSEPVVLRPKEVTP